MFKQPIQDIIKTRISQRTYLDQKISNSTIEELKTFFNQNTIGPFGNKARFEMIEVPTDNKTEKKKFGTYGFISGAQYFIVGAISQGNNSLEDFGYLMEKIILFATDLGLGTCWLGGTFKKSNFAEKIALKDDEILPAITPIGYTPKNQGLIKNIIRLAVNANNRKPWENLFFKNSFNSPLTPSEAGVYQPILEGVRLGPSAKNGQPWRIVCDFDDKIFHFFIQKKDPKNPESKVMNFQRLDIGIAFCHFDLVAKDLGLKGRWMFDDPKLETTPQIREYIMSWKQE